MWTHGQCIKWKVIPTLAKGVICKRCKMMARNRTFVERLNDNVKTIKESSFSGNESNVCGGFEITIAAKTRIEQIKF